MLICPVCNGLTSPEKQCPKCGHRLQVLDRLENYEDNYSPYLDYGLTDKNDGTAKNICTHLLMCPGCGSKLGLHVRCQEH